MDLGATPLKAFWLVMVPYLLPAIISGALMAFTLSMDELIVTYFTASAGTRTLPLEIFGRVKKGLDPSLNAISTVFILATVLVVLATESAAPPKRLSSPAAGRESMKRPVLRSLAALAAAAVLGEPRCRRGAQPLRLVGIRPAGGDRRLHQGDRHQGQLRDLRLQRGDALEAARRRRRSTT